MKIRYLTNSGFMIEHKGSALLMDVFDPERHQVLSEKNLAPYRSITALASHNHFDHFNPAIAKIRRAKIVLGYDIPKMAGAVSLRRGEKCQVNGMNIAAYGSTDVGVSFHIAWDGLSVFHAGDYNDWHWEVEGDEVYTKRAHTRFLRELDRMKEMGPIDVAFFPVDPRMVKNYWTGAVKFAKEMRPKVLIPMHFSLTRGNVYGKYDAKRVLDKRFFAEIAPYTKVVCPPMDDSFFEV